MGSCHRSPRAFALSFPLLTLSLYAEQMTVRDVPIRKGIALLDPKCVTMKGYQTADLEALQDRDFARSLRIRLGFVFLPLG